MALGKLRKALSVVWEEFTLAPSQNNSAPTQPKKFNGTNPGLSPVHVDVYVLPRDTHDTIPLVNVDREPVLNVKAVIITVGNVTSKMGAMTHNDIGYLLASVGKSDGPANVFLPPLDTKSFTQEDLDLIEAAAKKHGASFLSLTDYANDGSRPEARMA